ncbi:hypothetical protein SAMN05444392_101681 [Seinonella peptonophila]|uniref:Uncharacterized protein n=1 Tax=Seinonella peptonophila TaxID=112248 RepID=A0A1M4TWG9_9BACL|nr:hypothetical protein [Seinonella peptonophila]SHE48798.1 hypothetical protein SAMN05444392_101681 [Seinonella peptonophila]
MRLFKRNQEEISFPIAVTFQDSPTGRLVMIEEALQEKDELKPFFCIGCLQIDVESRIEVIPVAGKHAKFRRRSSEEQHLLGCPYQNHEAHMIRLAKDMNLSIQKNTLLLPTIAWKQPLTFLERPFVEKRSYFTQLELQKWNQWIQEVGRHFPYLTPLNSSTLKLQFAHDQQISLRQLIDYDPLKNEELTLLLFLGHVQEMKCVGHQYMVKVVAEESEQEITCWLSFSRFLYSFLSINQLVGRRIAVTGYGQRVDESSLKIEIWSIHHQLAYLGLLNTPSLNSSNYDLAIYFQQQLFQKGIEYFSICLGDPSFSKEYFSSVWEKDYPSAAEIEQVQEEQVKGYHEREQKLKKELEQANREFQAAKRRFEAIQVALKEVPFLQWLLGKNRQRKAERDELERKLRKADEKVSNIEYKLKKQRRDLEWKKQKLEEQKKTWEAVKKGIVMERERKTWFKNKVLWEIPSEQDQECMVLGLQIHYGLPNISIDIGFQYCKKEGDFYIPILKQTEKIICHLSQCQSVEEMIEQCWAEIYHKIEQMRHA